MKTTKYILLISIGILFLTFSSCDSYLEMPNVAGYNEDSVFTKKASVEKLISTMYYYNHAKLSFALDSRLDRSLLDCATDIGSGNYLNNGYSVHKFNKGTATPEWISNQWGGEDIFGDHYKAIRIGWILYDRVDEVPDATTAEKNRIKADVKTIMAMQYFEMMKRYGGVPLVKKRYETTAESYGVRSTLQETYDYIVQLCDEAIAVSDFPAVITDANELGRASKALAYGLKARAALYLASPLFNSDRAYKDDLGANSNLICLMKYNKNLWKNAADAAETAIKFCEANGMQLTDIGDINLNYTAAYFYPPSKGNTEMIMPLLGSEVGDFKNWLPRGKPMMGYASNMPTLNYVEMFQNKDGSFHDWAKDTITPINDPTYPYKNMDPRFKQIICYNGMEFYKGVTLAIYDGPNGEALGTNGSANKAQFAHYNHKYIVGFENRLLTWATWRPMTPYMRLTELYLDWAEALNEYYGPTQQVCDILNKIRHRSGMMADLNTTDITETSVMRKWIQRERAIELGMEEHRYFDLKRWKMGETFKGPIYDLKVRQLKNMQYTYKKYVYETRYWGDQYYLHPFPPSEVNKGYGLIQNPGW